MSRALKAAAWVIAMSALGYGVLYMVIRVYAMVYVAMGGL